MAGTPITVVAGKVYLDDGPENMGARQATCPASFWTYKVEKVPYLT